MPMLDTLPSAVSRDPGLNAATSRADIQAGVAAARLMNDVLLKAISATGVNSDKVITPGELRQVSKHIRENADLYAQFVEGHGNDEGNVETGFHKVQGDGGTWSFQGRKFVDTVADAIYHIGFNISGGRFRNEDGDQNQRVVDVAGWLNYFVNGQTHVFGTNGSDTLVSGKYSGELRSAADELFDAGRGDDKIWANDGNDIVRAGSGNDVSGGGNGNDEMHGGSGNDQLWGNAGNDTMFGDSGADVLGGGTGNDNLSGGSGNDQLWGDKGNDVIDAGSGNDEAGGGDGNDQISGGTGSDKLWGGAGKDVIDGGAGSDTIGGQSGDDIISGGSQNDEITGGDGDDIVSGDGGHDKIWGGRGRDEMSGGDGNDVVGGGADADILSGGAGRDTIYGDDGNDKITSDQDNDIVYGGKGNDVIDGGDGRDSLSGNSGNDAIQGGAGRDRIDGGSGRDRFEGGTGGDTLLGWEKGNYRDVFAFNVGDSGLRGHTKDVIEGFKSGTDKIDLSAYDVDFVDAFGGTSRGEVMFDGDDVLIDINGDGRADEAIELRYVNDVREMDFIL